jgi:sulfur dioxygenase
MNNLGLPHPKQMARAVPANLRCGRPEGDLQAPAEPGWAPLTWTFAGLWEIEPVALQEVLGRVQVVDVREPAEFAGPLGHIPAPRLLPLGELLARSGELRRDRPVVTVCRSGARSAQAALQLQQGRLSSDVANLAGGMLRWRPNGCRWIHRNRLAIALHWPCSRWPSLGSFSVGCT